MGKQEVVDSITTSLSLDPRRLARGSSEPAELFRDVGRHFGLAGADSMTKIEISRAIVERAGLRWSDDCDSSESPSGGGSTITMTGLCTLRDAIEALLSSEMGSFEVSIRPRAQVLRIFRNLTFKPWYALGEFIDNSITSALLNRDRLTGENDADFNLCVEVTFDPDLDRLIVKDNAGGIDFADVQRALQTSERPPDTSVGLSLHGVGLKAAAFWWGECLTIESFPLGRDRGWRTKIDLDSIGEDGDGVLDVMEIDRELDHGTIITIDRIGNRYPRGRSAGSIRSFLPSIYRRFLRAEPSIGGPRLSRIHEEGVQLRLMYNGEELSYIPPKLLKEPFWPTDEGAAPGSPPVEWFEEVEITISSGKSIVGWIGVLDVMSRDRAGFSLQYRGKSIAGIAASSDDESPGVSQERGAYKPRKIFGQSGSYLDQSFVGEFDLSQFGKSVTTDSVEWSSEEEDDFVEQLFTKMSAPEKNFIAQAQNFRRRRRTDLARRNDLEQLKIEVESTAEALTQAAIGHSDPPTVDEREDESEVSEPSDSWTYPIEDPEGHVHTLIVEVVENDQSEPFRFREDGSTMTHTMRVNIGHGAFRDLAPIQGAKRDLLVRLTVAMATVELFLPGSIQERSRYRQKLNEVLVARGALAGVDEGRQ